MRRDYHTYLRRFHEAKWDEEIIFDLSVPGQRGIAVPKPEEEIIEKVGKGSDKIPASMKRKKLPNLPEVHQMRVNRHYMRLTQEVLGADITPDLSQGTCTMKYSPKYRSIWRPEMKIWWMCILCRTIPLSREFWKSIRKRRKCV